LDKREALAFGPDGRMVATRQGFILLSWQIEGDASQVERIPWRASHPCRVAASPDDRPVAVGGFRTVRFWDTTRRAWQPGECRLPAGLRCLCYAPDGRALAAGTADGKISLLDARTQEIRTSLYTDQRDFTSLAWS